jgi:hypothetical protein
LVGLAESAALAELVELAASGVLVVLAASVELVVPVALAGLVVLAVSVVREGLVVSAGLVGWAAEIACPLCRVGAATIGNTIPSIAAGLLTKTGQPQTALAERRVVILSPNDRPAPGNRLVAKGAIWAAPGAEPVPAIGLGEAV